MTRLPDKLDSNARVEVRVNGVAAGTRRIIDIVAGANVTATAVDDGTNDKVTVTFVAVAGGGSAPSGPAGGALDGTYPNPGLAASVAGAGLAETSDVLSVNAGSGIQVVSDAVGLTSTGVTPGSYGGSDAIPILDVDAKGRIIAASSVSAMAKSLYPNSKNASVTLYGTFSVSATSGTPFAQGFTFGSTADPSDPGGASLAGPPLALGLAYVLDNSTTGVTASEDGIWLVDGLVLIGSGTPDSSPFTVRIIDDGSATARGQAVWYAASDNGVSCSAVMHVRAGSVINPSLRVRPASTQTVGGTTRLTLTRIG